jgi:serine/threonine protein kinase
MSATWTSTVSRNQSSVTGGVFGQQAPGRRAPCRTEELSACVTAPELGGTLASVQVAQDPTKVCTKCRKQYLADALFCPEDGIPLLLMQQEAVRGEREDSYLGKEILGHIVIQDVAGVGAMGRVYKAFQRGIDRHVAVKILHKELSSNSQLVARFNREAKVASKLVHPNVVQVYLAGQLADGALYIVMEYLDGLSLASVLSAATRKPLPLDRALRIMAQLSDAVGEAHAQGVVHRDLKPENVMLVTRGTDQEFLKVLDFGIARLTVNEQSVATATGLIFGTARYISPEGAQGLHVTPAGDVYALATLAYQMLSGRTPFDAEQAVALMIQQIHERPKDLSEVTDGRVAAPLAQAIMKNLAKDPKDRDQDARAFARSLFDGARASGFAPEGLLLSPMLRDVLTAPRSEPKAAMSTLPLQAEKAAMASTARLQSSPEFVARVATQGMPRVDETTVPVRVRENTELGSPLPEFAMRGERSHGEPSHGERPTLEVRDRIPGQRRVWPVVLVFFLIGSALALLVSYLIAAWGKPTPPIVSTPAAATTPAGRALSTPEPAQKPSAEPTQSGSELAPLRTAARAGTSTQTPVAPGQVTASARPSGKATLALTASPAEVGTGQSVQFAATLLDPTLQKEHAEDATFSISGPGVSTRLSAVGEGVLYRAALTLYEPGTYTVTFTISSGGKIHTQTRTVKVRNPSEPVPTVPAAPNTGVRWL